MDGKQKKANRLTNSPMKHKLSQDEDKDGAHNFKKSASLPSLFCSTSFNDECKGGVAHYPYECPIEVQVQEPLSPKKIEQEIECMKKEFCDRRKILISGLPHNCSEEDLQTLFKEVGCVPVSKIKDGSVRVLFKTSVMAKDSLFIINSTMLKCRKLFASHGHADSLLFVGNLPFTYTRDDLIDLFRPHGDILRCFIVLSPQSGLSKGYGFVEFTRREEALFAKQQLATKVIGLRSLRVDFSDNGMQTCEDLHSQTLFVDRLPKGYKDDKTLSRLFTKYGRVNFCQVAISPGIEVSRGFAFVDMSTSEEAENAQVACNGLPFFGQDIRVSFGMPCRHGACILQHKNCAQFKSTGKLPGTLLSGGHGIVSSSSESSLHAVVHHHQACPAKRLFLGTSNHLTECRPIKNIGVAESLSAPSIIGPTVCMFNASHSLCCDHSSHSHSNLVPHSCDGRDSQCPTLGKKRSLSLVMTVSSDAYDKAYIGQHQQGIPFTHPLKRIRMQM